MKTGKRLAALLLTACLLAGLALPTVWAEPSDGNAEITISTVKEFREFAQNCALDTWSQGRTVRLTVDLNLSGQSFTPIPTFGGTFLGGGHTISGLRITAAGSNMGLFRYLQRGAVVQDLHVAGRVLPEGSGVNVGGIVGVNEGAVRNCTFQGTSGGEDSVGGIAGLNGETGEIAGCSVTGAVSGKNGTGGVVGRNLGQLIKCTNAASVNTATPDWNTGVDPMTVVDMVETAADNEEEHGLLDNHDDTGGIAGFSSGVIQSCANAGDIGYPHVGYNVGGVAGRQTGYTAGCVNSGTVHGRKDVGGIVGQAEPYIALAPGSSSLDRLRTELDTLDRLIDRALTDAERNGDAISARLSSMGTSADMARDSAKALLDQTTDFVDVNIDTINTLSATVTGALDDLIPALDELTDVSAHLETLADRLEDALRTLRDASSIGSSAADDASSAISLLRRAGELMQSAARDLRRAVEALQSAVIVKDHAAIAAAIVSLGAALDDLGSAVEQTSQASDALRAALAALREEPSLSGAQDALRQMGELLRLSAESLKEMAAVLRQTAKTLRTINANVSLDWNQVRTALQEAGTGMDSLDSAAGRLSSALGGLQEAVNGLRNLSGKLGDAMGQLADAASLGSPIGRGLEHAFTILRDVTNGLAEDGPFTFSPLGEAVQAASDDLFDSLTSISSDMKGLQASIEEAGDTLSANLRAISRQFNTVFDVLLDAITDIRDGTDSSVEDLIEDTSDQDITATHLGKVEDCRNTGTIDGDRNVGGVAGVVSIEVSLDPESDLEFSLGSTYETKAVLQDCKNQGSVTAKKDCAGGLAGRMDLGAIVNGENYGPIESASGNYVGGVAGYAEGTIRQSYAKCTLSGLHDVGGIAGWAGSLRDCCAIATVLEGTERIGAVAGSGDRDGMQNNWFVDTGVAGIDSISYAGIAEPIAFDTLRQLPGIPDALAAFTLTLTADGEIIQEIPFAYGEDLSRITLPEIPEKEGVYGVWPAFSTTGLDSDITIEAVYKPWVTIVSSRARDDKLALALAEGQFTEEAALQVSDSAQTPPASAGQEMDVWDLELTGTDCTEDDGIPIRLLNRTGGKAVIWQYIDGNWVKADTKTNGRYLLLTMQGTSGTFCAAPAQSMWLSSLLIVAGGVLAALCAIHVVKKKGRKIKAAKKPAQINS